MHFTSTYVIVSRHCSCICILGIFSVQLDCHARVLSHISCLQLFWEPIHCSPSGSSVHGFLQARILEWVVMPSSRESSWPRDQTCISYVSWTGRWILHHCATWETQFVYIAYSTCRLLSNYQGSCKLLMSSLAAVKLEWSMPFKTTPSERGIT